MNLASSPECLRFFSTRLDKQPTAKFPAEKFQADFDARDSLGSEQTTTHRISNRPGESIGASVDVGCAICRPPKAQPHYSRVFHRCRLGQSVVWISGRGFPSSRRKVWLCQRFQRLLFLQNAGWGLQKKGGIYMAALGCVHCLLCLIFFHPSFLHYRDRCDTASLAGQTRWSIATPSAHRWWILSQASPS